jgi:hypothetical protein
MDQADLDNDVRAAIASSIRERGIIPSVGDVASHLRLRASLVDSSFARLADQHVFSPRSGSHEIHAYHPFCADPTDFLVRADGREWWAVCGWDALGIAPALGTTGTVETRCGDCEEPIHIDVGLAGDATAPLSAVLQVGVPAREFWKDIDFT